MILKLNVAGNIISALVCGYRTERVSCEKCLKTFGRKDAFGIHVKKCTGKKPTETFCNISKKEYTFPPNPHFFRFYSV